MSDKRSLSVPRYFASAGIRNVWIYPTWLAFAAFVVSVVWGGGRANLAPFVFFFLVPFASCTGLIAHGRRGKLDLLLGAGATRHSLWVAAVWHAWVLPSTLALVLLLLSGPMDQRLSLTASLLRLLSVLLFSGGICFAAGMYESRFLAPIVWLVSRLVFVMYPSLIEISIRLSKGIDPPGVPELLFATALAPEVLLTANMPVPVALGAAVLGLMALFGSRAAFQRAELAGRA